MGIHSLTAFSSSEPLENQECLEPDIEIGGKGASTYPEDASGAVAPLPQTHRANLIAKPAKQGKGRKYYYHYDVVYEGEVIVSNAWEPCFEACRALLAKGITGSLTFFERKRPRLTVKSVERGPS